MIVRSQLNFFSSLFVTCLIHKKLAQNFTLSTSKPMNQARVIYELNFLLLFLIMAYNLYTLYAVEAVDGLKRLGVLALNDRVLVSAVFVLREASSNCSHAADLFATEVLGNGFNTL